MTKLFRRFILLYLLLCCLPFPFSIVPWLNIQQPYDEFWMRAFQYFNDNFLHLTVRAQMNGSGDAADNYFKQAVLILVAFVLSIFLRRFEKWKPWADSIIRWYLASMLLSYGINKLYQFPPLSPLRLHEPFGQASPMAMLWNFMGASRPYTVFAGVAEVTAGILLLIPRFFTLGALLALGVMTNVFVLNMCYDVPVKLFSFQLILLALWTMATDYQRVRNFVLGRVVPEIKYPNIAHWYRVQILIACILLTVAMYEVPWSGRPNPSPYPGVWAVDSKQSPSWVRMIFDSKNRMTWQNSNGGTVRFEMTATEPNGSFDIHRGVDRKTTKVFFELIDPDHLKMTGTMDDSTVDLTLTRETQPSFPLLERGFHWINEYPYNN